MTIFCRRCGAPNDESDLRCARCSEPLGPALPARGGSNSHSAFVPNHLVPAILATLACCPPTGVAAVICAAQVNLKLQMGDVEGAKESSRKAMKWIALSLAVALVANLVGGLIGGIAFNAVKDALIQAYSE